jgi:hypothetical protein
MLWMGKLDCQFAIVRRIAKSTIAASLEAPIDLTGTIGIYGTPDY